MTSEDRRYLIDYYREDIGRLANLVGRNLDGWLQDVGSGLSTGA